MAFADKCRATISAVVITKNEEANIGACLDALRWADELIVVDAESTDRTVEIAKGYTSKVFVRSWPGYGTQKNFAMEQATTDWILIVDADERIGPDLREEIIGVLTCRVLSHGSVAIPKQPVSGETRSVVAYRIPRRNFYYGCWIRYAGQYPDMQLRLVQRGFGRYNDLPVHEHLAVAGAVDDLKTPLDHYTHPTVLSHELKIDRYSALAAQERITSGRPEASWHHLLFNPMWTFVRLYVIRQGFRDGRSGFLFCAFSSAHVMLKYAKIWEQNHCSHRMIPRQFGHGPGR